MALGFGRKKAAPDAQNDVPTLADTADSPDSSFSVSPAPADEEGGADLDAFDLDVFAAQLESGEAATQPPPVNEVFAPSNAGSAFDFPVAEPPAVIAPPVAMPELQTPDFNQTFVAEERNAIASGQIPPILSAQDVPVETGLYEPQIAPAKRKLPLVPIVGALAVLGLAGGAASFLMGGKTDEDESAVTAPVSPRPKKAPPQVAAPQKPVAPKTASLAPKASAVAPQAVVVTNAPRASLKALWQKGADAKHRGDYSAARRLWQQGLQMQPGNRGFIESIAKLPK